MADCPHIIQNSPGTTLFHGYLRATSFPRTYTITDNRKAIQDLNRYMDIEQQFELHSNRPYYEQYLIIGIKSNKIPRVDIHGKLTSNREDLFSLIKKFEQETE